MIIALVVVGTMLGFMIALYVVKHVRAERQMKAASDRAIYLEKRFETSMTAMDAVMAGKDRLYNETYQTAVNRLKEGNRVKAALAAMVDAHRCDLNDGCPSCKAAILLDELGWETSDEGQ